MDAAKIIKAKRLEADAARLRKEAFESRPLPDHWRVGQRVRYLRNKDYCCDAGELGTVVETSAECAVKSADEYQVFWTRPDAWNATLGGNSRFYTTPDDVELLTAD